MPAAGSTIPMRQRARQACKPCQQRKKKCNGDHPCAACIGYGYDCIFAQPGENKTSPSHSHDRTSRRNSPVAERSPAKHAAKRPRSPSPPIATARRRHQTSIGILDPIKSRFVGNGTAIASPWHLGIELNSANPPRLHSFAWNAGVRTEILADNQFQLPRMMAYEEAERCLVVYFDVIQPIYGILHREMFMQRCGNMWRGTETELAFEAVVSGAVALGSLFAPPKTGSLSPEFEGQIMNRARSLVDGGIATSKPTQDYVAAWILRTLYLRATTRPHTAWMASCIAMHVAEAMGLHHELDAVAMVTPGLRIPRLTEQEAEMRRRVFWVAVAVNSIVSYEYGRRRVDLGEVTCRALRMGVGNGEDKDRSDRLVQLVELSTLVARDDGKNTRSNDLDEALEQLGLYHPEENPAFVLLEADVGFGIYRRLRLRKREIDKHHLAGVINLGRLSLRAASAVAAKRQPWWHVISVPFQFVCILLAIDNVESLAGVKEAMAVLEEVVRRYNTHLAREALQTAKLLIMASRQKKMTEVGLLEFGNREEVVRNGIGNGIENGIGNMQVLGDVSALIAEQEVPAGGLPPSFFQDDNLFDWDEFLNPTNTLI